MGDISSCHFTVRYLSCLPGDGRVLGFSRTKIYDDAFGGVCQLDLRANFDCLGQTCTISIVGIDISIIELSEIDLNDVSGYRKVWE